MVSRGVQGCPGVLHVHAGTFENGYKANYFVLYGLIPSNYTF